MTNFAVRRTSLKNLGGNHRIFMVPPKNIQSQFDKYKDRMRPGRSPLIYRIGKDAFVKDPTLHYYGPLRTEANKVYTKEGKIVQGNRKRSMRERLSKSVLLLRNETTESLYKQSKPTMLDTKFQSFLYMYATVDDAIRKKHFGKNDKKHLSYEQIVEKFADERLRGGFLQEKMPKKHLDLESTLRGSPSSGKYYTSFEKSMNRIPPEEQGRAVKSYLKLLKNTVTDLYT